MQQSTPRTAATDVVDIPSDRHDRPTVPVMIGAKGPYRFLIDTGAERTVLAKSVAASLGLQPTGQRTLMGIAGSRTVDIVAVDEVSLGRHSFYGLDAPLLDGYDIGAEGIVGLDSLQGQRVLIDFEHARMAVGEARALGGDRGFEIVVHARRRSGQLILTNALVDGIRTDVVIDTGAESSIGNRALQKALERRRQSGQTQLISVTGQQITADIGLARAVVLDGLTLNNTAIAFADAPPFRKLGLEKRPALFLGMTQLKLFRRIAIDFAMREVLFDMPSTVREMNSRPDWDIVPHSPVR
jgi:predicted aspartyl protease